MRKFARKSKRKNRDGDDGMNKKLGKTRLRRWAFSSNATTTGSTYVSRSSCHCVRTWRHCGISICHRRAFVSVDGAESWNPKEAIVLGGALHVLYKRRHGGKAMPLRSGLDVNERQRRPCRGTNDATLGTRHCAPEVVFVESAASAGSQGNLAGEDADDICGRTQKRRRRNLVG
ncbi:hypothetical protein K474DRAFT_1678279 [Panus rudis PR-1116 ss-1]|nr:hypothetical protein K474DRAFT_1678279 [Panus rudis PR-1116 ss-1]